MKMQVSDAEIAISPLVARLANGTPEALFTKCADALMNITFESDENTILVAKAGAVPLLVARLTNGGRTRKEELHAASLLANLSFPEIEESTDLMVQAGAIPPLVALLTAGEATEEEAARALWNVALVSRQKDVIAKDGGIPALVALLANGRAAEAKETAAWTVAWLCREHRANARLTVEAGGIRPLVALLTTGTTKAKKSAASTLRSLCVEDDEHRRLTVEAGGLPPLAAHLATEASSERSASTESKARAIKMLAALLDVEHRDWADLEQ